MKINTYLLSQVEEVMKIIMKQFPEAGTSKREYMNNLLMKVAKNKPNMIERFKHILKYHIGEMTSEDMDIALDFLNAEMSIYYLEEKYKNKRSTSVMNIILDRLRSQDIRSYTTEKYNSVNNQYYVFNNVILPDMEENLSELEIDDLCKIFDDHLLDNDSVMQYLKLYHECGPIVSEYFIKLYDHHTSISTQYFNCIRGLSEEYNKDDLDAFIGSIFGLCEDNTYLPLLFKVFKDRIYNKPNTDINNDDIVDKMEEIREQLIYEYEMYESTKPYFGDVEMYSQPDKYLETTMMEYMRSLYVIDSDEFKKEVEPYMWLDEALGFNSTGFINDIALLDRY